MAPLSLPARGTQGETLALVAWVLTHLAFAILTSRNPRLANPPVFIVCLVSSFVSSLYSCALRVKGSSAEKGT